MAFKQPSIGRPSKVPSVTTHARPAGLPVYPTPGRFPVRNPKPVAPQTSVANFGKIYP